MPTWLRHGLGTQMCIGASLTLVISLPMLRPSGSDLLRLTSLAAACFLVVLVVTTQTPERAVGSARLLSTIVVLGSLGMTGVLTDGFSTSFTGMFVLVFVYVGLTCPAGTAIALLPLAAVCWLLTNAPVDSAVLSRLPVVVGLWLVVGELLSRKTGEATALRQALMLEAERDPLTGLLNRSGLTERLDELRTGDAVVFVDLDHFKKVNDTFGHATGDAVLRDLGRVVLSVLRPRDTAVRYGGEEVVLLLPRAGVDGADRVLGRLKAGWAASHPELTFSAGIAVVDALDGPGAVLEADLALYEAKNTGRNRWVHSPVRV